MFRVEGLGFQVKVLGLGAKAPLKGERDLEVSPQTELYAHEGRVCGESNG